MTDTLERLRACRPEPTWVPDPAVLDAVLAAPRRRERGDARLTAARPGRRRHLVVGASLAAAAAVLLPTVLPADTPGTTRASASIALQRLATVAGAAPFDDPAPGQFRHLLSRNRQVSDPRDGQPPLVTSVSESWVDAKGNTWRRDVSESSGTGARVDTYYLPVTGTAYDLDTMPTDPYALRDYLRAHVTGSTSTDEAVFVAVGEMLRGGYAPPALRAAAVRVLAMTPHVYLGDARTDQLGRPAQEFDFIDRARRPDEVQALYFDPSTAQIVQESDRGDAVTAVSVLVSADVVDSVPADVRSSAVTVR